MRHVACQNVECVNHGAPYFDFEPAETIVLCPVCEKAMPVATLEALAKVNEAKAAAAEQADKEAQAAAQAEAAANPPPTPPPSPLDLLAALPPNRVVTASELLAILRPEPTEEKPDA